ncbi:hypothetical protein [Nostoc commune]|uniref:hypothetical protein n=1 Tax=Nostoc commune TaxID=1178 RepID=UPI0011B1C782|nr:hypothetical protein [Nostoc commune]
MGAGEAGGRGQGAREKSFPLFPMPNAQCPMPNPQFQTSVTGVKLTNTNQYYLSLWRNYVA